MLWKCCTQYASKFGKQQWPQDWQRSVFIPIPKKDNAKKHLNYCTIALISQASKVMLKILQARFQQYMNHELSDVQAGFKRQRNQRSNCQHPLDLEKAREFQKNNYFCFIDYAKAFPCVFPCGSAGLVAQLVKNLPAMWETWVWFLGSEDPLGKGTANHSSIIAWRIP